MKVTIIPRSKGSLGFAQYLPEELMLYQKEALLDMIKVALGGRIAEEIYFGRVTTGASDDLKKVTQIATSIVTTYGMNDAIGLLNYSQEEGYAKPYSEATGALIDGEVKKLVDQCYNETKELLLSKKDIMEELAKKLLEHEVISLPDIIDVLGPRPYPMKESIKEYLEEMERRKSQDNEGVSTEESEESADEEDGDKTEEKKEDEDEDVIEPVKDEEEKKDKKKDE